MTTTLIVENERLAEIRRAIGDRTYPPATSDELCRIVDELAERRYRELAGLVTQVSVSTSAVLDTARRATDVERERCLSLLEAAVIDWTPTKERAGNAVVRDALLSLAQWVAGGDAGPHSDAALAWRRRVTGESASDVTNNPQLLVDRSRR